MNLLTIKQFTCFHSTSIHYDDSNSTKLFQEVSVSSHIEPIRQNAAQRTIVILLFSFLLLLFIIRVFLDVEFDIRRNYNTDTRCFHALKPLLFDKIFSGLHSTSRYNQSSSRGRSKKNNKLNLPNFHYFSHSSKDGSFAPIGLSSRIFLVLSVVHTESRSKVLLKVLRNDTNIHEWQSNLQFGET